jgi:hypothetical protein
VRLLGGLVDPLACIVFEDSILMFCFLAAVEMKPRTLCACQPVAFMISARLAPLARPIISRIFAPLLSARGALVFFADAGLAPFFGAAALALPPLAVFWPLGAPFFWLAPFLEEAFSGATCAPGSVTAAALSGLVSVLVMVVLVFLFCAVRA